MSDGGKIGIAVVAGLIAFFIVKAIVGAIVSFLITVAVVGAGAAVVYSAIRSKSR